MTTKQHTPLEAELLAALEALYNLGDKMCNGNATIRINEHLDLLDKARAAITKATGV